MVKDDRPRRATSADVARESGVSRATVSYVLNETPDKHISQATRDLVLHTARRLGHVPNPMARALKTGSSNIVVCLIPALTLGFVFDHALDELTRALADRGYALLINRVSGFSRTDAISDLWGHVAPKLVMTIGGTLPHEVGALTSNAPAPVLNDSGIVPHRRVGRMQAEYLISQAHVRIGYAMPEDPLLRVYAEQRFAGVADACAEAGLEAPQIREVDEQVGCHGQAVQDWIAGGVTGVCAHNDDVALLTLAAMENAGLRAPSDLAVIGSDDVPLAAAGLTTVALDIEVCAALFIHEVLTALGEPAMPRPERDILRLVTRSSA
jgi:DNA-binding LacI/PurR family transcriptional regulator